MEVRPIVPEEFEAVGALTVDAYTSLADGWLDEDYIAELKDVAGRVASAVVLVAVDRGVPIGGVTYVPGPGPLAEWVVDDGVAGIRMLAVSPEAQGRGAGRALTVACLERAMSEGKKTLVLHSTPLMTVAHRIYETLGFVRQPDLDMHYGDLHLMAFTLDLGRGKPDTPPGSGFWGGRRGGAAPPTVGD